MRFRRCALSLSLLIATVFASQSWVFVVVGSASSHQVSLSPRGEALLHHHQAHHDAHRGHATDEHSSDGDLNPDHVVPVLTNPSVLRSSPAGTVLPLAFVVRTEIPSIHDLHRARLHDGPVPGPAPPPRAISVTILRI